MKKYITTVFITLFLVFFAGAAHAALVTESFTGEITFADSSNPFGVTAGDAITWEATYDLAYLDTMFSTLNIGESTDMNLSVTLGSRTFVETEDMFYGPGIFGSPLLTFDTENNINGISILVDDMANLYRFKNTSDYTGFNIYAIDGFNDGTLLVSGNFNFEPVPVPAAAWLLGSGLLGMLGLRRRSA